MHSNNLPDWNLHASHTNVARNFPAAAPSGPAVATEGTASRLVADPRLAGNVNDGGSGTRTMEGYIVPGAPHGVEALSLGDVSARQSRSRAASSGTPRGTIAGAAAGSTAAACGPAGTSTSASADHPVVATRRQLSPGRVRPHDLRALDQNAHVAELRHMFPLTFHLNPKSGPSGAAAADSGAS